MENDQMRVWLSGLNETAMTPTQLRVILFFRVFCHAPDRANQAVQRQRTFSVGHLDREGHAEYGA